MLRALNTFTLIVVAAWVLSHYQAARRAWELVRDSLGALWDVATFRPRR